MKTLTQQLNTVMDALDAYLTERPEELCACPRCCPPLEQTAPPAVRVETSTWSGSAALAALGCHWISQQAHEAGDGLRHQRQEEEQSNRLEGYTDGQGGVWLRPDVCLAVKTLAHELAHNVLGHPALTAGILAKQKAGTMTIADRMGYEIDRIFGEAEAETVALLVCDAIGYPDGVLATYPQTLQYILRCAPGPFEVERRAKVIAAAEQILAAGRRAAPALAA